MKKYYLSFLILCFSLIFILTQSCASNFSRIGIGISTSGNQGLGFQIHNEIIRTQGSSNKKILQSYVSSVGQILAQSTGRTDIPFTFTVINSSNVNAYAAPGGYIYVTTGMLRLLDNEAQLAAILSHEIGHVIAGHHIKQALAEYGLNIGFDFLGNLTNVDTRTLIPQLAQMVILQRFSQREEIAADEIGTLVMTRAGYSPSGMVQLLQLLETLEDRGIFAAFLSSHPASEARVQNIQEYITVNNLQRPSLILDRPIFHQVTGQI